MTKQIRRVFFFLIALVGILAASTAFFGAKSFQLAKRPVSSSSPKVAGNETNANQNPGTPAPASSSSVTRAAASTEKPSNPTDTYTVQKGETLFAIAQSQGSTWQDIAEANGISDVNKIHIGQVLIIPKASQVSFAIDNTKSTIIQKDADAGKYPFRLSAEDTARSDAPGVYGLQVDDTYTMKDRNMDGAVIVGSHDGKNYMIKLVQPVTKGEKGIWAIESIKPV